jgi:ABC-type lipoprotein release transport system permease subunit
LSGPNKMSFSAPYRHWIRSAFLFLIRSGRSTAALSIMVVAAVASLIFLSSLAVGVNDAMIRSSAGLFSGHVSASGLPSSLRPDGLTIKGVKYILRRFYLPGGLFQGANNEAITLIGVDADLEKEAAWPRKIIKGRFIKNNRAELLLSSTMSEKLKADVGDSLNFSVAGSGTSSELKVVGIYRTGIAQLDLDVAFCSFEALPFTPSTWSAAIFLDEGVKPEKVVSRYNELFEKRYQFVTWKDLMPDLVQLINLNYVSMTIVIILVFAVVALGISCAFIVFIFRNLREYGIMKAMGVTSIEIAFLIVTEVVLINIFACLTGGIIGVLAVVLFSKTGIDLTAWTSHNQYFAVSGIIFPRMTIYSLTGPPVVSIIFGLISAVWPAILIARKRAAEVLRSI